MQFLTYPECESWLQGRQRSLPTAANSKHSDRAWIPKEAHGIYWLARQIAAQMMEMREPCLLWIQEWGIWDSGANFHLYYKLRTSYGDRRRFEDAPGHEFLGFEVEELATFLHLSLLNGWGGYVLTHLDYINAFFSHDGFIDFYSDSEPSIRAALKPFGE